MDKHYLIESARGIKPASAQAADEYYQKQDLLVSEINHRMLERKDIKELVGENNLDMMKDNHKNHAKFIRSVLKQFHPEILVETVLWVFRVYRSRGFHQNYWSAQLSTWIDCLKMHLSQESFEAIIPLYEWMIVNIPLFSKLSDEQIAASGK